MSLYPSSRTGEATELLLNKVENECIYTSLSQVNQGALLVGSGTSRQLVASQRLTDSNIVIANTALAANGLLVCTNNATKNIGTNTGVDQGLGFIYVGTNGVANIVSNECDLNITLNLQSSGTITTSIFSEFKSARKSLIGAVVKFTFASKVTKAIVSSEITNYIYFTFSDGSSVYKVIVNTSTGTYSLSYLSDSTVENFTVLAE